MYHLPMTLFILVSAILAGCATTKNSPHQMVEITSEPPGARVSILPAHIEVTTPATVKLLRRKEQDLQFDLDGYESKKSHLYRRRTGESWPGGLVGLIDEATGADWELVPDPLHVVLVPEGSSEEANSDEPNGGVVFMNIMEKYAAVPPTSLIISLAVDGKSLALLGPLEYVRLDLAPGTHEFEIAHRDVWMFEDEYTIEVGTTLLFVSMWSGMISTKRKVETEPLHGFPVIFTEIAPCEASDPCEIPSQLEYDAYEARKRRP